MTNILTKEIIHHMTLGIPKAVKKGISTSIYCPSAENLIRNINQASRNTKRRTVCKYLTCRMRYKPLKFDSLLEIEQSR